MQQKQPGYERAQLLAIPDIPPAAKKHYFRLKAEMEEIVGVKGVSAVMEEPSNHVRDMGMVYAEGRVEQTDELAMDILTVDRNFLEVMNLKLAAGRSFEREGQPEVVFPDTAEQRRKEIGIRKIVGASVRQLVQLLAREYVVLVVLANLIAWPLAYFLLQRWLQGFAYRVELQPGWFLLAGGLTLGVALLSSGWQALRAAWVNPVDSLREE